jgi:hypothetical protein
VLRKTYPCLGLALVLSITAPAHAQTGVTTSDAETCTAMVIVRDDVRAIVCQYTDGSYTILSNDPGSTGRALWLVYIPGAGAWYTPRGRSRMPRAWTVEHASGHGHPLDPAPLLGATGCRELDAAWLGHTVYQGTLGLPGVTWSVWAAPEGREICWLRS